MADLFPKRFFFGSGMKIANIKCHRVGRSCFTPKTISKNSSETEKHAASATINKSKQLCC